MLAVLHVEKVIQTFSQIFVTTVTWQNTIGEKK